MDADITRVAAGPGPAQVRSSPHPVPVWVYVLGWMALMPLLGRRLRPLMPLLPAVEAMVLRRRAC